MLALRSVSGAEHLVLNLRGGRPCLTLHRQHARQAVVCLHTSLHDGLWHSLHANRLARLAGHGLPPQQPARRTVALIARQQVSTPDRPWSASNAACTTDCGMALTARQQLSTPGRQWSVSTAACTTDSGTQCAPIGH